MRGRNPCVDEFVHDDSRMLPGGSAYSKYKVPKEHSLSESRVLGWRAVFAGVRLVVTVADLVRVCVPAYFRRMSTVAVGDCPRLS